MKKIKFLRNYGDYKIGVTYDNVDLEKEEKEKLLENGTLVEVTVENDEILPKKVTVAVIKESYPKVYEQIVKEGQESRDLEVAELNKKIEELTSEIETLKAGIK